MKRHVHTLLAAAFAAAFSAPLLAAATPEELKSIGTTHLPWGAEKAGNKEGTIPAYAGPVAPPASYDPKTPGIRPDPFADEKPLFSIDASNMEQYADKLADGTKEMLKKYPHYRLDVYPSHRTASYPQLFLDNAVKNASECKLSENELLLVGCYAGTPFPFPKSGSEVMWNRIFKFDQHAFKTDGMGGSIVDSQGNRTVTGVGAMFIQYPIFDPKRSTPIGPDEAYERMRIEYTDPARKAGEKLIIHDSVDMVKIGRKAWQYLPGQRRVKLSPDIAYDTPSPTGGGASVVDESAVFYGALDRYNYKLLGKKELYIPYNTYKVRDPNACPDTVAESTKNVLNPDCVRWELHRVWVVEATVKEGKRHVYPRRVMYWDEDLPGVGIGDAYDSGGRLYRVTHTLPITFYENTGHMTDEWVTYDLATGAYTRQQNSTMKGGWVVTDPKPDSFFNAETMAGGGIR
ncbi:DUF1329 domain-containing protein [Thauera linaloolentis]|uniref:DUF1329 domain-containing protein n=1 Tax=Thauera linaloolentis (strain DSM 12138 / JCM 21573 / CCUG 41526 / CIP 105981 / IAM 15112 / NBRC 102519 / 47Lol) TaxID=1123367 RepID=N6Z568_THAL4|nr:DUF1329 domain-containing protein [Thauera linaloolentis]ENO87294.1 hypothetical protein C666_11395 [Thauera linaloolentis 47Lol = DSM 12138]MCM8566743.1 DUF1329 domain-containing protein [Thauera linaloolentis]